MQKTTKAMLERMTQREARVVVSFSAKAMAKAKRIQAHTSFIRADDMAIRPSSELSSLSSAKMRASTGNAVTDRATPRKRMKVPWLPPWCFGCKMKEKETPMMKGRIMPATAMARAFLPIRRITVRSISTPTRKRKYRRPTFAIVSRTMTLLRGKMVLAKALLWPNTEGPKITPPCEKTTTIF